MGSVIPRGEVSVINWGIRTVLDAVEASAYVAQIVSSIALLVAAFAFLVSRNQLNFGVITSCDDRFQRIVPWMESRDRQEREQGERQYVDLYNEQLFYFRNNAKQPVSSHRVLMTPSPSCPIYCNRTATH